MAVKVPKRYTVVEKHLLNELRKKSSLEILDMLINLGVYKNSNICKELV